jgi:hypothetical protein
MHQKKDIVRGRYSFCLSYLDGWQDQPQQSNISAELQISRYLTDDEGFWGLWYVHINSYVDKGGFDVDTTPCSGIGR